MTCITSSLDIPRFSVSLLIIISYTYFTCEFNSNNLFFLGKIWSYVIGFLPILSKTLNNVCLGTGARPNSKQASSHCPLKDGYRLFTKASFSLGQLASNHQWSLLLFSACLYSATLAVSVSCGADNSFHDSMGINSQCPTTNFARTATLSRFIRSSYLAFSCCGLIYFRFLPLFFLKYSWMWRAPRERQRSMIWFRRRTNRRKGT